MTEEDFMSLGEPENEPNLTEEADEVTVETDGEEQAEEQEEQTEETEEQGEVQDEEQSEGQPNTQQEQPRVDPERARQTAEAVRQRMAYELAVREAIGKVNPYTGTVINNREDYEAYRKAYAQSQQNAATANLYGRIQNGTATADEFNAFIQSAVQRALMSSPDLQRARAAADRAEQAERQAREDAGRSRLQADIDALNKEYPSCNIKTIADIKDPAMVDYIKKGLTVSDAYYLTHRQEIAKSQQAAAKQAVINQTAGKAHLKTTAGTAAEDSGVTEEMIAEFKPFFPNATRKELIQKIKGVM